MMYIHIYIKPNIFLFYTKTIYFSGTCCCPAFCCCPSAQNYLPLHHTQSSAAVFKPLLLIHCSPVYCLIHCGRHSSKILFHWGRYLSKLWAQNSLCAQDYLHVPSSGCVCKLYADLSQLNSASPLFRNPGPSVYSVNLLDFQPVSVILCSNLQPTLH